MDAERDLLTTTIRGGLASAARRGIFTGGTMPIALPVWPFGTLAALTGAAICAWSFTLGFLDGYMLARIFS